MNGIALTEKERSLRDSADARVWAKEFMKYFPEGSKVPDVAVMTSWFANSMMAMYDHAKKCSRENKELGAQVRELERTIKRSMKLIPAGEHLHVGSIIFEQNAEISRLKRRVKRREQKGKG